MSLHISEASFHDTFLSLFRARKLKIMKCFLLVLDEIFRQILEPLGLALLKHSVVF